MSNGDFTSMNSKAGRDELQRQTAVRDALWRARAEADRGPSQFWPKATTPLNHRKTRSGTAHVTESGLVSKWVGGVILALVVSAVISSQQKSSTQIQSAQSEQNSKSSFNGLPKRVNAAQSPLAQAQVESHQHAVAQTPPQLSPDILTPNSFPAMESPMPHPDGISEPNGVVDYIGLEQLRYQPSEPVKLHLIWHPVSQSARQMIFQWGIVDTQTAEVLSAKSDPYSVAQTSATLSVPAPQLHPGMYTFRIWFGADHGTAPQVMYDLPLTVSD